MLQNDIEALILEILEDNPDEFDNLEITFQQDGAPAHYYGARCGVWKEVNCFVSCCCADLKMGDTLKTLVKH
ncbi:hypothetical protein JTB14_007192 [Gonioctena quinquepunctata]|nr:hypothetical protein JTB14_007192 [Gonioctena quinquepunctata]